MLCLGCRHHILELIAKAVWEWVFPEKHKCPGENLCQRFKIWWTKAEKGGSGDREEAGKAEEEAPDLVQEDELLEEDEKADEDEVVDGQTPGADPPEEVGEENGFPRTFGVEDRPNILEDKFDEAIKDLKKLSERIRARGKEAFPRGDYQELFGLLEVVPSNASPIDQ